MQLNPYGNAIVAAGYIWGVVSLIQLISPPPDTPDTFLTPILALSVLVFSVATMSFIFFYRPVVLLLEHKKDAAVTFFLKTLVTFGALTAIILSTLVTIFGLTI